MATMVTPAAPTVNEMVNAHIRYVRSRPYRQEHNPIVETGVVQEVKHYKNILYMLVKPDSGRLAKWVSEFDFLSYVRYEKATGAIAPAA